MTDKYAVIGNPVSHSKSPEIHRMFAQQTGQDISYEKIEAPLDGFAATVERLRKEGYKGCNVTVPFKLEAFSLLKEGSQLTERAYAASSINTLFFKGDKIYADNTDGIGLVRDIQNNFGIKLNGKHLLLLGAGGAAYGVALPLLQAGVFLTLMNRTEKKALMLAKSLEAPDQVVEVIGYQREIKQPFDVVINATSTGLSDEMPQLPPGIFALGALAYDMMYGRETPFMKFAREQGAAIVSDGLGMLVEQAAEAFYIWRGVRPDTAPVLVKLRDAA